MRWFERLAVSRPPDFIIGSRENPYMLRWWVIPRNKLFNIYLHRFIRSDEDEALHDHPWINMTYLLKGSYTEHTIAAGGVHYKQILGEGAIKLRLPRQAHRVELHDGQSWSLFLTGPVVREWGFHCEKGWKMWKDFVALKGNNSSRGLGCGE